MRGVPQHTYNENKLCNELSSKLKAYVWSLKDYALGLNQSIQNQQESRVLIKVEP